MYVYTCLAVDKGSEFVIPSILPVQISFFRLVYEAVFFSRHRRRTLWLSRMRDLYARIELRKWVNSVYVLSNFIFSLSLAHAHTSLCLPSPPFDAWCGIRDKMRYVIATEAKYVRVEKYLNLSPCLSKRPLRIFFLHSQWIHSCERGVVF